jgi:hypothetical protein
MEKCNACGLEFDYWGRGGNAVFNSYLERKHAEDARREEQEFAEYMRHHYGEQ